MGLQCIAHVIVVGSEGDRGTDLTMRSVALAGQSGEVFSKDRAWRAAMSSSHRFIHIIEAGVLVLPSFYLAMIHSCLDFSICPCASMVDGSVIKPDGERLVVGQIVGMDWAFRQIGDSFLKDGLNKLVVGYRGAEIPHCLCVEIER